MTDRDPVFDIKSRLSIEDVVAPYVPLKRTGRSLKACCPFHNEKTPSFVVSPERQLAYCFGCNKGGDMFSFIQEIEGVDFKGALEILADRANLDLSDYRSAAAKPRVSKDQKDHLYEINTAVTAFYADQLWSTKPGAKVMKYLENRGFTAETVRDFQLGLAPDSFEATFQHLTGKQYGKRELLDLGLILSKDTASQHVYDRFRLRLMFPIHDAQGRVVAFGGRAIKKGDEPKYLNSPETVLYHKSRILYGFHRAKAAIRENDLAVVVEGYMDVMASHQAGVTNVVASSGTALAIEQLKLLKRFTTNIAFAFDTDRAGEDALARAVELGQELDLNMRVIRVPDGKDPDDCIRNNPDQWTAAIAEAPHYLDYYLHRLESQFDLSSIQGKREAAQSFLPLLKSIGSLERDHFIQQLGFVLKTDPSFVYDEFNALTSSRPTRSSHTPSEPNPSDADVPTMTPPAYFLALMMSFPKAVEPHFFTLSETLFSEPLKKVYNALCTQYNSGAFVDVVALLDEFDEPMKKRWQVFMLLAETRNEALSEDRMTVEMEKALAQLQRSHKKDQADSLRHQIRAARAAQNVERERELFQQYSQLFQS